MWEQVEAKALVANPTASQPLQNAASTRRCLVWASDMSERRPLSGAAVDPRTRTYPERLSREQRAATIGAWSVGESWAKGAGRQTQRPGISRRVRDWNERCYAAAAALAAAFTSAGSAQSSKPTARRFQP